MEDAYKEGKIKAIGLSNFQIEDIENILNHCEIIPSFNQILVNITHYPKVLIKYCQNKDILVGAYSPNATGKLNGELIKEVANKYQCTLPQLGIQFDLQLGCVVFPKTTHVEYMIENQNLSFVISNEDMETLSNIGQYISWKGADSD
ncbi:aldo/keto reductase [Thomasclavelia sp.]